jgi:ribosomal protein L32
VSIPRRGSAVQARRPSQAASVCSNCGQTVQSGKMCPNCNIKTAE